MKQFFFRLFTVLVLAIACTLLIQQRNWLWLCVIVPSFLVSIGWFYRLYTFNTRKIAFLLDAIENDDPAVRFYEHASPGDSSMVNVMLNRIARILYNVKQETAQREKYYELIMDFVETGIVVLNSKGSVYQKNKEAMNLLGLDVLTHVKQLSRISDELMTALEKAVPGDKLQIQFNTERGTVHLALRVSGIRIKDEELRIIALSDINRELDEREIDSWIRLTRVLTHEIMNSLTPVTSLSETLLALPGAENEEMKQGLETIHSTGKGLINFVMSYRKLTRLPSPEPSLFYVRPFLERMIRLAQHQHPCPNITLSILEAREDLIVFADENLIAQVVTNLLKNAIQAIGNAPDGKITLKAYCDPQESIRIEIANNGPAIPPDAAGQIFVPFFTTKEEGSGIGLSLVQRLVELHHGQITLVSEVGKGSTFSIYIPQDKSVYTAEELAESKGEMEEQRVYSTNAHEVYIDDVETEVAEAGEQEAGSRHGTILIVEDNEELRRYLFNGLSAQFNLIEAENGQKALEVLKENDVDLILSDVMMPVMDGVKLCKSVKQNLRTCHIPVYLLSAKVDIKYQLQGLQVGADDYIPKPFSMDVLIAKILNMLRTRYRIFEHYSNAAEIEPEKIANNAMDEELLRKAIAIVEKNMSNVEFSTEQFASEMNMSRSNLHLKLKAITGKSAIDFIHKIRFNRACQLLKEGKYTVSEISFMVGYNTPSYFSARFKKYIGCLPTEYGKQ